MRALSSTVADVATSAWISVRGERRVARGAARLPLPQHPETPWCPEVLDLADLADVVDPELTRAGLAGYHVPAMAALLAFGADPTAANRVVDVAPDVVVAGLLAAAALRPVDVVTVRSGDDAPKMTRAVRRNRLDMQVIETTDWNDDATEVVGRAGSRTIIVGGFESSADLLRATHEALRRHSPTLLVPFPGDATCLPGPTRRLLRRLGYVGYRLKGVPEWQPRRGWRNHPSATYPYWLLVPSPIDDDFIDRFDWWVEELAAATPDPMAQRSIGARVGTALRDGGFVHAVAVLGRGIRASARTAAGRVADRVKNVRRRRRSRTSSA